MSGGSYDYLCFKSAYDIGGHTDELLRMISRLKELGYHDVAMTSENVLKIFKALERQISKVTPVWKVVEWYDSGDVGIEDVVADVEAFRLRKKKIKKAQSNPEGKYVIDLKRHPALAEALASGDTI